MSIEEPNISSLEQRISAIENDDFKSSKKMYDHTRHIFSLAMILFTAITASLAVSQYISIDSYEKRFDEFIEFSQQKISNLTGSTEVYGYVINDNEPNIEYTLTSKILDGNIIKLSFSSKIEIKGKNEIYGHLKGFSAQVIFNKIEFVYNNINAKHLDFIKKNLSSISTKETNSYININTAWSSEALFNISLKNCEQLNNLNNIIENEVIHELKITPIILNHKGIVETQTMPFTLSTSTDDNFTDCPLN